jgi:hypothetical protein
MRTFRVPNLSGVACEPFSPQSNLVRAVSFLNLQTGVSHGMESPALEYVS